MRSSISYLFIGLLCGVGVTFAELSTDERVFTAFLSELLKQDEIKEAVGGYMSELVKEGFLRTVRKNQRGALNPRTPIIVDPLPDPSVVPAQLFKIALPIDNPNLIFDYTYDRGEGQLTGLSKLKDDLIFAFSLIDAQTVNLTVGWDISVPTVAYTGTHMQEIYIRAVGLDLNITGDGNVMVSPVKPFFRFLANGIVPVDDYINLSALSVSFGLDNLDLFVENYTLNGSSVDDSEGMSQLIVTVINAIANQEDGGEILYFLSELLREGLINPLIGKCTLRDILKPQLDFSCMLA